ncbi:hypothetical protein BX666DRAFT_1935302 [Dichotomocladium elegans]|nr:hypothetical protein BX666DRAFT_1935302 [Dichotomocladium elegans]
MNSKAMRDQARDEVCVTVFKKRIPGGLPNATEVGAIQEPLLYITDLTPADHREIAGRRVTINPDRRDMLYWVQKNIGSSAHIQFRYTKQKDKTWMTKKYRRLLERLMDLEPLIRLADGYIAAAVSSTLMTSTSPLSRIMSLL